MYSIRSRFAKTSLKFSIAAVSAVAIAVPLSGAAQAASSSVWDRVAACESGNNWATNTGNGFHGGLQFTKSTWKEFGGGKYAPLAHEATRGQQIEIAERVLKAQGPKAWPVCAVKAGLTR
ncbi:transglycosylase family protein [Streptomyces sp. NPDC057910]|uniref:transglycosylase family protein n=1 Tax=Streptomyces sp. NPDC057910 TaxID=3346278 RepID=UPI0036EA5B2E